MEPRMSRQQLIWIAALGGVVCGAMACAWSFGGYPVLALLMLAAGISLAAWIGTTEETVSYVTLGEVQWRLNREYTAFGRVQGRKALADRDAGQE